MTAKAACCHRKMLAACSAGLSSSSHYVKTKSAHNTAVAYQPGSRGHRGCQARALSRWLLHYLSADAGSVPGVLASISDPIAKCHQSALLSQRADSHRAGAPAVFVISAISARGGVCVYRYANTSAEARATGLAASESSAIEQAQQQPKAGAQHRATWPNQRAFKRSRRSRGCRGTNQRPRSARRTPYDIGK